MECPEGIWTECPNGISTECPEGIARGNVQTASAESGQNCQRTRKRITRETCVQFMKAKRVKIGSGQLANFLKRSKYDEIKRRIHQRIY